MDSPSNKLTQGKDASSLDDGEPTVGAITSHTMHIAADTNRGDGEQLAPTDWKQLPSLALVVEAVDESPDPVGGRHKTRSNQLNKLKFLLPILLILFFSLVICVFYSPATLPLCVL